MMRYQKLYTYRTQRGRTSVAEHYHTVSHRFFSAETTQSTPAKKMSVFFCLLPLLSSVVSMGNAGPSPHRSDDGVNECVLLENGGPRGSDVMSFYFEYYVTLNLDVGRSFSAAPSCDFTLTTPDGARQIVRATRNGARTSGQWKVGKNGRHFEMIYLPRDSSPEVGEYVLGFRNGETQTVHNFHKSSGARRLNCSSLRSGSATFRGSNFALRANATSKEFQTCLRLAEKRGRFVLKCASKSVEPRECGRSAWHSLDANSCRIERRRDGDFDVDIDNDLVANVPNVFKVECFALGVANYMAVADFTFKIEGTTSIDGSEDNAAT